MLEAPPYLSASSIGTWKQCRLKYKFSKIDKLPDPSGWEAVLGNFVHDVLEDLLALPRSERDIEAARGLARVQWDDKWGAALADLNVDLADMKGRAWKSIEGYFYLEDPKKVTPAGLEHQINASIDGVPIRGFIDRWEIDRGSIKVVDYKAGSYPKRREWQDEKYVQLLIYAYALEAEQEIPAGSVELLFVRDRRRLRKKVTADDMALVESVVRTTYDQVQLACETGDFEPSPSRLCDWCNYKNICPAWAE